MEVTATGGRTYKNAAEARASWAAGHDFADTSVFSRGTYVSSNDRDLLPDNESIILRHGPNNERMTVLHDPTAAAKARRSSRGPVKNSGVCRNCNMLPSVSGKCGCSE